MRLDKFLSHTGFGSRKEVKELLKKKQVSVNGKLVKDGEVSIDENHDQICVADESVFYRKDVYLMLNKPQGVVSATHDAEHRTVIDLLSSDYHHFELFPVGRLDKDTTGFLLLTNDGELAHQLLSPKKKVPKLYRALVSGIMTSEDQALFKEGIDIGEPKICLPAELNILSIDQETQESLIELEIVEGKFHQVKRMVKAVGKEVKTLHRLSMGGLPLDPTLKVGQYRELTALEESQLLAKLSDKSVKK